MSKPSIPIELDKQQPSLLSKGFNKSQSPDFNQEKESASQSSPLELFQTTWLSINKTAESMFQLDTKKHGSKKSSDVWKYFTVIISLKNDVAIPKKWDSNRRFAACNNCGQHIPITTASKGERTNGSMVAHLRNTHETSVPLLEKMRLDLEETFTAGESDSTSTSNKRKLQQIKMDAFATTSGRPLNPKERKLSQEVATALFLCDTMSPLSMVQNDSFRNMIKTYDPLAKPLGPAKMQEHIELIELDMKNMAVKSLINCSSVCLTVDHWTSKANDNYTGLTAHYIDDDFSMHSIDLGLYLHSGASNADRLEEGFLGLLFDNLNLSGVKIFAVTTDTTANMNSFGKKLENHGICHVYCTDHVLQLTCKLCYSQSTFGAYAESVEKARNVVNHFGKSTQAVEHLKKKQKLLEHTYENKVPVTVVKDVVTRWWSTYSMIERLLYLRPAIDAMTHDGMLGNVSPVLLGVDWGNLAEIRSVLIPFKNTQKFLEGEKYVTSSMVIPCLKDIRNKLTIQSQQGEETASKTLATKLLLDFEERWGTSNAPVFNENVRRGGKTRQAGIHPSLVIAHFLDPRFKNLSQVNDPESRLSVKGRVLQLMKEYETKNNENSQQHLHNNDDETLHQGRREIIHGHHDSDECLFADVDEEIAAADANVQTEMLDVNSLDQRCRDELKRYLSVPSLTPIKDSDPLQWWKTNQSLFPTLANLAKIYLAVQATSAPSERVFSTASRILSDIKSRLNPEMAGKMLFVRRNWEWYKTNGGVSEYEHTQLEEK
jgi:hAT family dimerisation domain.